MVVSGSVSRRQRWRWIGVTTVITVGLASVVLTAGYLRFVVHEPGEHLERQNIRGIIANESPVFYRDGKTRVGVFFADEHRTYVPFDELPVPYVASIVAAEDSRFWSHAGFDVWHIGRAMLDNLKAGGVVAGGSTLTQQTAKNLFYRPDRSIRSKLVEALNALRLEAHFSKTEILSFYANQFHVSGNGRGLGIAARHFFDKEVEDLDVLESAFLAGLVKAPSYYDPFLGDEARRERAIARAHDRTRYVLRRLTEVGAEAMAGPAVRRWDDEGAAAWDARVAAVQRAQEQAHVLLSTGFELPFKRGVFRYESSALLDEVARRLAGPPFAEVLAAADIENPATAGVQVVTTLDPDAQRAATYGLWHHLTELGMVLEGRSAADFVRADSPGPRFDPDRPPIPHDFRLARVESIRSPERRKHLSLDLGGSRCVADREAMVRAAVAVERGRRKDPTAKVPTARVDAFVDGFAVGDTVWVSVRRVDAEGAALCDLEVRPELQGAVLALEDGRIRAMVGGNDNRNFNRATALRQFGSTWKPLVFHAALRLGWSPEDVLDNRRNVFPFSTTYYYPRPDHKAPDEVSLSWAAVKSENLASIWLLYHLVDRMDDASLRSLADTLGLARGEDETEAAYRLRIQRAGVLPTPARLRESLYQRARHEVVRALPVGRHPEDRVSLLSLLYGWGYEAERREVADEPKKLATLDHHWTRIRSLRAPCEAAHDALRRALAADSELDPADVSMLWGRREAGRVDLVCGAEPEGFAPVTSDLFSVEGENEVAKGDAGGRPIRLWIRPERRAYVPVPEFDDVLLGGRLHASTVDAVSSEIERLRLEQELTGAQLSLYDPDVLYWHPDFRVLMALRYVRQLAEELGVRTEVKEVLSMPLGASEVSLEDLTLAYDAMTSGKTWSFPGFQDVLGEDAFDTPPDGTLLIREIRTFEGELLYRVQPTSEEVAGADVVAMTDHFLQQVVEHGTGRRARGAIVVGGHPLPVGGKTGTTNDYRNSAFVGVLPIAERGALFWGRHWTLGAYVGYDDNRPMTTGRLRVGGAQGALPAWVSTARGLATAHLLDDGARAPADGWSLEVPAGLRKIQVDPTMGGLPVADGEEVPEMLADVLTRTPVERVVEGRRLRIRRRPGRRLVPREAPEVGEEATEERRGSIWRRFRSRSRGDEE